MEQTIEAVGVGNPVADILINMDQLPTRDRGATLNEISYQFGGKVPTAMTALGRLGVRCGMIGAVGGDAEGTACIADFERHNVDTSQMIQDLKVSTRLNVSLSDESGERNILRGRAGVRLVSPDEIRRRKEYVLQARALHLSAAGEADRTAAEWMHEAHKLVCFDADGFKSEYEEIAKYVDAFITSESYYTDHYPGAEIIDCCRDIASKGPSIVVVTLGAKGCACYAGGKLTEVPVYDVKVMDATGAGDTFHGAFLYGMLQGWDPVECADFASAVSAIKCTAIGGRAAQPTLEMVNRSRKNIGGKKYIDLSDEDKQAIRARAKFYRKPHGMQK